MCVADYTVEEYVDSHASKISESARLWDARWPAGAGGEADARAAHLRAERLVHNELGAEQGKLLLL